VAFADGDVLGQVAGVVAHGFKAVLLVLGLKWPPAVLKSGARRAGLGVDVDGVLADGKVLELELDGELALALLEGGGAGVFTGAGLDGNDEGSFGLAKAGTARRQRVSAASV
jgi:hypothetical protein